MHVCAVPTVQSEQLCMRKIQVNCFSEFLLFAKNHSKLASLLHILRKIINKSHLQSRSKFVDNRERMKTKIHALNKTKTQQNLMNTRTHFLQLQLSVNNCEPPIHKRQRRSAVLIQRHTSSAVEHIRPATENKQNTIPLLNTEK